MGPGADQPIEIAGFKAMALARQRAGVADAVAARAGAKDIRKAEGGQGSEATGTAAFDGDARTAGFSRRHQGLGGSGTVGHIHHAPLAIESLPVGPAKAGGAAVVHIHHAPAPRGPELNAQVQTPAGHAGGAAVALHQQRRAGAGPGGGRIEPGMGLLPPMAGKPERLGPADRLQG